MKETDNQTLQRIKSVLSSTFKLDPAAVTESAALNQVPGWDSLGHINVMMEIEREFSIRIPTEQINHPQTIADLAELITQLHASSNSDGRASA